MSTTPPTVPATLLLQDLPCVVVGGGTVAERKVSALRAGGARVRIVAPAVTASLRALVASDSSLTWREGEFKHADLDGAWLVVSATGVPAVDGAVSRAAAERRIFMNSADDPDNCSFFFPAVVHRDPVVVSISTSGASPALASFLRARLDATLEQRLGDVAEVLGAARRTLHRRGLSSLEVDWTGVVDDHLVDLVEHGNLEAASAQVHRALP